jgi:hypothetical protein
LPWLSTAGVLPSDAALRPGQLRRIEPELVADAAHGARIKGTVRASEREPRLAAFAMYRNFPVTLVTTWMLVGIDAAPVFHKPLSKCCGFHCLLPLAAPGR